MKNRFFHLFILFALLISILVPVPARRVAAATLTVTNTDDSGPGSLREAVSSSGNGDTIVFSGVSGTILLSSTILIGHSLTITGPGSVVLSVSGGDAVRVFYIAASTVNISGLTITHGKVTDDYGGGIFKQNGTLTLEDVALTYNQALKRNSVGFGGGIANYGGTLIITNSRLAYNTANNMGGGLENYFDSGLSMTDVVVDHNQVLEDSGGGLSIRGPSSAQSALPVNLDRVSITNNSAFDSGGGLFSDDSLTITNSLIAGNTVSGEGGAGGMLIYDGGTGSKPVTVTLTNTTIAGNTSANSGGGLFLGLGQPASSATLNNITIAANQASGEGAGIYQYGNSPVNLENSLLAGNLDNGSTPDDCYGSLVSLDYNLVQSTANCTLTGPTDHTLTGVSAGLSGLADNGGPTQTMALLPGSPALEAGNDATCALTDQRGVPRPQGLHCDMGAFELVQNNTLSVEKTGSGSGTVTSAPPGINCGATCAASFPPGSIVNLTALPEGGSLFDGWSGGACSGAGTCAVTLDAAKSVIAAFSLVPHRLYLPLILR